MKSVEEIVAAWKDYLDTAPNWRELVAGIEPKPTGCGPVYELPNPIDRPNESFAIADMRNLKVAEPHYHPDGATEIYFVLQGSGLVVVRGKEQQVTKGSVVVISPNNAHFTIPNKDLVLAAINTPPFRPEDYIVVTETNSDVNFDHDQFRRLSSDN